MLRSPGRAPIESARILGGASIIGKLFPTSAAYRHTQGCGGGVPEIPGPRVWRETSTPPVLGKETSKGASRSTSPSAFLFTRPIETSEFSLFAVRSSLFAKTSVALTFS